MKYTQLDTSRLGPALMMRSRPRPSVRPDQAGITDMPPTARLCPRLRLQIESGGWQSHLISKQTREEKVALRQDKVARAQSNVQEVTHCLMATQEEGKRKRRQLEAGMQHVSSKSAWRL